MSLKNDRLYNGIVRIVVLTCGLTAGLSLFNPSYAQDQPVPLLVITDLRARDHASSIAEANAFSEFIRKEVERTGLYRVISRSSMEAILKGRKFPLPCHELPCFVSMGKILGADQVLAGNFSRDEAGLEITLRLVDVKAQSILKTIFKKALTSENVQLFGGWGQNVIGETFNIDEEYFKAEIPGSDANRIPSIPASIRNKFPGMVYVPAGEVMLGSEQGDDWERPAHRVFVDSFYMGKYEVTNKEYALFVQSTGHRKPPHWSGGVIPPGLDSHPVTWVSFEDAEVYCEWAGGRLPTEAEWERAAKGNSQNTFPWGGTFNKEAANTWEAGRGGTSPVGSYFQGASPYGVEDLSGNVFEWVTGFFKPYPGNRKQLDLFDMHLRILKGGSWNFSSYYARTSHRFARSGGEQGRSYGFRIVKGG